FILIFLRLGRPLSDVWRADCSFEPVPPRCEPKIKGRPKDRALLSGEFAMTIGNETKIGIPVATPPARPLGWNRVQARMKIFCFCVVLISLCAANRAAAQQCSAV